MPMSNALPASGSTAWYPHYQELDTVARTTMDVQDGFGAPNVVTATAYTLALTDAMGSVSVNTSAASIVTIPLNSAVAFRQGTRIRIGQTGVGEVQIAGDTGVTVRNAAGRSPTTRGQFSTLVIIQRAINTWWVEGDPDWSDLSNDPIISSAIATAVNFAPIHLAYNGTTWPTRPSTTGTNRVVYWVGPTSATLATNGTAAGGTAAAAPGDLLFLS